jgi:hypothetical protein
MGYSILGPKADSAFASITKICNLFTSPAFAIVTTLMSLGLFALLICALKLAVDGIQILRHLQDIGLEAKDKLQKIADASETTISRHYQAHFAQHVCDFVVRKIKATQEKHSASEPGVFFSDHFLIYHPGTDWHASFEAILEKVPPLPTLAGKTHNLDSLQVSAAKIREMISLEATIHILMPSAHEYLLPDNFALDPALFPIVFEGELGYSSQPYVWVNMPAVKDTCFHHIGRLSHREQSWRGRRNNENLVATNRDEVRILGFGLVGLLFVLSIVAWGIAGAFWSLFITLVAGGLLYAHFQT